MSKPGLIELLKRAALHIEINADDLRRSHSVRGRWKITDAADLNARGTYDDWRELAKLLRRAARYWNPNPLGGPAQVFIAMADRIRAGESYHDVLDDYGFKVVTPGPVRQARR